ncbi:MAG: SPOR domain-containing protein [Gammaproteobacteria bacterium]
MAKDYAKRVFTTTRKPKKKRLRIELFVIPVLFVMCIVGYVAFKHKADWLVAETTWVSRLKTLMAHKPKVIIKTAQAEKMKPVSPVEPDLHFDFYNDLPNMRVTLPEESAITSSPSVVAKAPDSGASATKKNSRYILQIGLFKDSVSASQLRLSLLLSGIEAEIIQINTNEGEIYRVQQGPFINQADAKKLQRQLQDKGIVSVIKKV